MPGILLSDLVVVRSRGRAARIAGVVSTTPLTRSNTDCVPQKQPPAKMAVCLPTLGRAPRRSQEQVWGVSRPLSPPWKRPRRPRVRPEWPRLRCVGHVNRALLSPEARILQHTMVETHFYPVGYSGWALVYREGEMLAEEHDLRGQRPRRKPTPAPLVDGWLYQSLLYPAAERLHRGYGHQWRPGHHRPWARLPRRQD